MAEIAQQLMIRSSRTELFRALSEAAGLASWWTTEVSATPEAGSLAKFSFAQGKTVIEMRVETLERPSLVVWRCLGGIEEWEGTELRFELSELAAGATLLEFRHQGWRSISPVFARCSFDWAQHLASLRSLLETGRGVPHGGERSDLDTASSRQENRELVRRLYGSLMAKGDLAAADELLAPDYVDHDIPGLTGPGNRSDLASAVSAVRAAFPDIAPRLYEMTAEADWVAVRVEAEGTHTGVDFLGIAPSGKRMNWREIHFFRIADGRIAEHRGLFDQLAILRQLAPDSAPSGPAE